MKKRDKVTIISSGESGVIMYEIPKQKFAASMYSVRLNNGRYVNVIEHNLRIQNDNVQKIE